MNILPSGGEVFFLPDFFKQPDSNRYFELLLDEIPWKQEPVKLFGKEIMQPRLTAWYGDPGKVYSYSGITMQPLEWTETLKEIKEKIETKARVKFNSALLNLYRNGQDSMGWHRDNEKELGINPVIGSVNFGASRIFKFRNYKDKSMVRSVELTHGSFLLMQGETQHHWEHQVPKTSRLSGARINITFRRIL